MSACTSGLPIIVWGLAIPVASRHTATPPTLSPEDALECEPGEWRTLYIPDYVCPWCGHHNPLVTGLAVATDSYCVSMNQEVKRAFVPLHQLGWCPCGEGIWIGSDPPFPAEILYRHLETDRTKELIRYRILDEGTLHGWVH